MSTNSNPKILVTGDLIREVHVYQGKRLYPSDDTTVGTRVRTEWGGANLLQSILEEAQPGVSALSLEIDEKQNWPTHLSAYALYEESPLGFKNDPLAPGEKPKKVWRVAQPLGYGAGFEVPPVEPPAIPKSLSGAVPQVLLVDDGAAGFRTVRAESRWFKFQGDVLPQWVVLKTSQPFAVGDLWRDLVGRCTTEATCPSLVVIVSADDLRRDGAHINRGLSWERTITDTCQTISQHPQLTTLKQAAHILVVFRREGVLWFRQKIDEASLENISGIAIVDPRLAEGQWKATLNDDKTTVFGHLSVFAAAISLELANGLDPKFSDESVAAFIGAIKRGLIATRELRFHGHGIASKETIPAFPLKEVAAVLQGNLPKRESHQPQDEFIPTTLPSFGSAHPLAANWTIAAQKQPDDTPLYGLAFQTAIYGPSRLSTVPHAKFGDLRTMDREEIETLRSLRQMIQAYEDGGPQKQPLCIAAFGPPGAGKSFGIKQIALEVLGKEVPLLEFNLSQFSDSADLIGAFHQVRDRVLSGRTPVAFWDEFDSEQFRWLQFLLAPMQDGKFQSGQLTHTLGKCIFVFAGATSWDFEHFGPAPKPENKWEDEDLNKYLKSAEREAAYKKAQDEFRLKKGPDFISRLSGHINVLGPNRRMLFNFATGQWDKPDASDITFPVRRALLLRSMLKAKDRDVLKFDYDLLNALLRQPRYTFGSRSMEKIVEPLKVSNTPLRPDLLPPPQVLAKHLDRYESFQKLLSENTAFLTQDNIYKLAAAIHENYRRMDAGENVYDQEFLKKFENLDARRKATNLAAAARIPAVLAVAGLCVVPGKASEQELRRVREHLKEFLNPLRIEEHERWRSYMLANGWLQHPDKNAEGEPDRDNDRRLHNCMLPFDKLSLKDQKKDDNAICTLPETVDLVGFKIDVFPDLTLSPR
jgi:hypothetical protein